MVRYSFLVRLFHPLLHAGLSRRILDHPIRPRQAAPPALCSFKVNLLVILLKVERYKYRFLHKTTQR
jgi:hypothetical protein